ASVVALAEDSNERRVLGEEVNCVIHAYDETNTSINVAPIARMIKRQRGVVGLVGVQSNQYPRAMDLAREFRKLDVPVAIGGFHVSGTIAMLDEMPTELKEALDLGISLFAGEAEHRLDEFLIDAYKGELKPLYNFMDDLPDISDTPIPFLPVERVRRTASGQSSFDAGRGCPFECSFCTIINVQGRQSRYRTGEDVANIVKRNLSQGVKRFFITDDNFARNRNWEEILDRLIELKEEVDIRFNLVIQVDTLCHKIPRFIDKCVAAGVKRTFIGLENINPDNLKEVKKRQNRITEYRSMVQAWKNQGVFTIAGYILGFPGDTKESILHHIEILKREIPIDLLEFFYLTPLPGSEDHKKMVESGAHLEPDLNKYDLCHVCCEHPRMSKKEWEESYTAAWESFYSDEHGVTLLKRARATGVNLGKLVSGITSFYGSVTWEHVHPLECGFLRRKSRRQRRPGLPRESILKFYPEYWRSVYHSNYQLLKRVAKLHRVRRALIKDSSSRDYTDLSLEKVSDNEIALLEMYTVTDAAKAAADKELKRRARSARRKAAAEY
ncbi:MAG: radical SAM protein, partial [Gammaproteobacteria bacterium]|nr:radical SAM protein [Gammaproteobacteria bacterium]